MDKKDEFKSDLRLVAKVLGYGYLITFTCVFIYFSVLSYFSLGPAFIGTAKLLLVGPIIRIVNPPMSDEEIITRFRLNRKLFEQLVEIHKEKCFTVPNSSPESSPWPDYPEIKQLINQVGLIKVIEDRGLTWFPDPYSENAGNLRIRLAEMRRKNSINGIYPTLEMHENCRYGSPRFEYAKYPIDPIVKGVIYFPEVPRILNGKLLIPSIVREEHTLSFEPLQHNDVLESLNDLPDGFTQTLRRCAYRKIEPQWFVYVCPEGDFNITQR